MLNELEVYKLGVLAERARSLSLEIAIRAYCLEHIGKGFAVVAEETRNMSFMLYRVFDELKANPEKKIENIEDSMLMIKQLVINGYIELLHIEKTGKGTSNAMPLAVILEDVKTLTEDVAKLFKYEHELPVIIPKVSPKNAVVTDKLNCIVMTVGGVDFVESIQFVNEVCHVCLTLESREVCIRGINIPVVDVYNKLNLKAPEQIKFAAIVNSDYTRKGEFFAIPLDTLPTIIKSDAGISSCVKNSAVGELVRECWNCEEGKQMIFLDYAKLVK